MSEPVSLARPPALKTGDRVAVLCVSSPVDPARWRQAWTRCSSPA